MLVKYNGFAGLPAGLKLLLPAAFVVLASCASAPPAPPPAAAEATVDPALETAQPVTDVAQAAAAANVSLRSDAPLSYVVKKGDTLWDIAGYYLKDPWQWPQLWYENPQIKNPHLIYPGDRLRLIWVAGRPRVATEAGGGADGVPVGGNTVHLLPTARASALEDSVPTVPIEAIRNFLNGPRLVTPQELATAPYIVQFTESHVAVGANDGIFVKGLPPGQPLWAVVEPGSPYVDPDTHETLGFEALPVGTASLVHQAEPSTLRLTTSAREALIGDRLLPIENVGFKANFLPHAPSQAVAGRIISVFGGVVEISQFSVVAINRGSNDGLDPGTVLSVLKAGYTVPDPYSKKPVMLPDQYAGTMMVFKTTPRLSYALVLSEKHVAHVLDKVAQPVSGEH